jgi:Rod binding domain-containing protein
MLKLDNYMTLNAVNTPKEIPVKKEDEVLREYANQFEAILIKQMLDTATKSENSIFPKSAGSDIYKSMYNDTMSKELSGTFGFSELLFKFLKENN